MESISVFDMLSIGVGPSSSHTLGPWRAAKAWIQNLQQNEQFTMVSSVSVDLFGSLSLTGKGHATDIAVVMGLLGTDPVTFPTEKIPECIDNLKQTQILELNAEKPIPFIFNENIKFNKNFLDFHPNGISFTATLYNGQQKSETYYSIGGGFIVQEERKRAKRQVEKFSAFPYSVEKSSEILAFCAAEQISISELVLRNELSLRSPERIDDKLKSIWSTMLTCMYTGCHTEGNLPGGLNVRRRS